MRYPSPAPFDRSQATGMKSMHVELADSEVARTLAGAQNENLKLVERRLGVRVGQRGTELHLSGPEAAVSTAVKLLEGLASALKSGRSVYREDVEQALKAMGQGDEALRALSLSPIITQRSGRHVTPRSLAQQQYVELIRTNDVVFGLGPAGTGKTYLAMAMAVQALTERKVKRIILARPAVEAGEKLGFLPGDLAEKVNPYLRPLYDALHDMMEPERAAALLEQGVIEVAPLAFMRGRTLNDCFAILDEAQNTTVEQMKMFLTRIGYHSRAVVTGDVTQIDLPTGKQSGLVHARRILQGVEGVAFAQFTDVDVVRHPVVAEVIKAYARDELGQVDAVAEPRPSRPTPPKPSGPRPPPES
ncbi:MAG: PhoH family protein [Myxococcaceae bacterium]|nr:PhoH family protein [Myxococcaceae bacterium]